MNDGWSLIYEDFRPEEEGLREALCTLGNGVFATRGAAPESVADGVHYPGTYLAGGYNRLATEVAGHVVENEDLVNMPNWLPLSFRIPGADWLDLAEVELLSYRQELDLERGLLSRDFRFEDSQGRVSRIEERRLVHMDDPHLAALSSQFTPENWSGALEVRAALDGRVLNTGVARYRGLDGRHLDPLGTGRLGRDGIHLEVQTIQSRLRVAEAARTRVYRNGRRSGLQPRILERRGYIAQEFALSLNEKETVTIEKVVALYSSRDSAVSEPLLAARTSLERAGDFDALAASQARAWSELWGRFDMEIGLRDPNDTARTATILRLHLFHLLQTTSPHTMDRDVGVPARGLHGEAYRGHIFWDELFIFPLLNFRLPEITRSLLRYRHRRLDEACAMAEAEGYQGAMYPWQSGSDGREESQSLHLNPKSGRWLPDLSRLQRHVNCAIAYNVWQYYLVTRHSEFLAYYGAEMMLCIARFLASLCTHNQRLDRYEILGVMGPDEFHDAYPDSEDGGLNNNAYTNVMTAWVLTRALDLLEQLPRARSEELLKKLKLGEQERARWEDISRKMRVVFHEDGIVSQFEGYERLRELDWDVYHEKYGDIQRLDRILEAEQDTPNRYRLSKQADVLMLFYLFSAEELEELFERLGYPFSRDSIPKNVDYYIQRTSHGSTLSRVVHSWVFSRSDRAHSWRLFTEALNADVADVQGGTTQEGIHLGAMAGVVDLVQRGWTGLEVREDMLCLAPSLPDEVTSLRLCIHYREHSLDLLINHDSLKLQVCPCPASPVKVCVDGELFELRGGDTRECLIKSVDPADAENRCAQVRWLEDVASSAE
jgi:alpha,alpha-trehalase